MNETSTLSGIHGVEIPGPSLSTTLEEMPCSCSNLFSKYEQSTSKNMPKQTVQAVGPRAISYSPKG